MDKEKSTTTVQSNSIHQRRPVTQNTLSVWLTDDIDPLEEDCQNTLNQLRGIVNDINICTQPDEYADFLTRIDNMNSSLIVSNTFGQQIVPLIHDSAQLHCVNIFFDGNSRYEQWLKQSIKINGMHTEITSDCEFLQQTVKQCNQDPIAVSFVNVDEEDFAQNLNELEPTFMYTQIFKEILLEMDDKEQSIKDFIQFCRRRYINDICTLKVINEFERDYSPQSSIKWYTREPFVYQMVNQALRMLEGDIIINMGFFIRDLHQQIQELHQKQINSYDRAFDTLYRGQVLSKKDFEKLVKAKGGLMSFNNFLSTSTQRDISFIFVESASKRDDIVSILFKMTIDPSISSASFAFIRDVSHFPTEEEILFSMHTVFRIIKITKMEDSNSGYQVHLKLTADDDQELRTLTDRIREEVMVETGWKRLGVLLVKIGQFDKAEELYKALFKQTSVTSEKGLYYNNLGYIKDHQGDYMKAIEYYEKGLEIFEKTLLSNDPLVGILYGNIGVVYRNMGAYSKALSFHKKALKIYRKTLPPNHPSLAISYHNIGLVYNNMGEYSKAFSSYGNARKIFEKTLHLNHHHLATSYHNIGLVYHNMGKHSKALSFYEKAHEIYRKTLPPNHPWLATSYNNIGLVFDNMGEYSKALSFYEEALEICEKTLPSNHPSLATTYNNIGLVYNNMEEYSKALSFYEKACQIYDKTLPSNHPSVAIIDNNIAEVYYHVGEYSKALLFYKKALGIHRKTLPSNRLLLATSYSDIGFIYGSMGKYSKALWFHEKTCKIFEKILSPNHPHLATSYHNIGFLCGNMGKNSKALSFYDKAHEIYRKTLPSNHPLLATSYNNIGLVFDNMGEHSKALSFYEEALEICEKTLPSNHLSLATSYNNVAFLHDNIGNYSKALISYENALRIDQKRPSPDHPDLVLSYNNIGILYYNMEEYSKAFLNFERAQNILESSLPRDQHHAQSVQRNVKTVKEKLKTNVL